MAKARLLLAQSGLNIQATAARERADSANADAINAEAAASDNKQQAQGQDRMLAELLAEVATSGIDHYVPQTEEMNAEPEKYKADASTACQPIAYDGKNREARERRLGALTQEITKFNSICLKLSVENGNSPLCSALKAKGFPVNPKAKKEQTLHIDFNDDEQHERFCEALVLARSWQITGPALSAIEEEVKTAKEQLDILFKRANLMGMSGIAPKRLIEEDFKKAVANLATGTGANIPTP